MLAQDDETGRLNQWRSADGDELVGIVQHRTIFTNTRGLEHHSRVGTFTVQVRGNKIGDAGKRASKSSFLKTILTLRTSRDRIIDSLRRDEKLRDEADMPRGRFTYRTLKGARFPSIIKRSMAVADDSGGNDYTLMTERSSWRGIENQKWDFPTATTQTVSAEESDHVYEHVPMIVEVPALINLKDMPHASVRLENYGYEGSIIEFKDEVQVAKISGGRSIPDTKLEYGEGKNHQLTHKLTLMLPECDVYINGKDCKIKLVLSADISTKQKNKTLLLTKMITASHTKAIKLHNMFVITVIPLHTSTGNVSLRPTGFPVIPSYVDVDSDDESKCVTYMKGDNIAGDMVISTRLSIEGDKVIVTTMGLDEINNHFRSTDQWLNIKHSAIEEYVKSSGDPNLQLAFKEGRTMQVTKSGVEFGDVEFLRSKHERLYKRLCGVGYRMLLNEMQQHGYDIPTSEEEMRVMFRKLVEGAPGAPGIGGPSIGHSEEIRSFTNEFGGTESIDAELLLVRVTLSRLLIIGIGEPGHNPLGYRNVPVTNHLMNHKRAQAMLVPLSVVKSGLIVYYLNGSIGDLFKHVNEPPLDKNGYIAKMKARSVRTDEKGKRTNVVDMFSSGAFKITASVFECDEEYISNASLRRKLRVVSPSGMEFDVTPICSEICNVLAKTLLDNVATICWHPLFTIVTGMTTISIDKKEFEVIVMPAKRPSSLAKSYHDVNGVVVNTNLHDHLLTSYANLLSDEGFDVTLSRNLPLLL
jgi:hypothetical protein